jgi:hypothetical protein
MAITGLSMAAHAQKVANRDEAMKVLQMMPAKYPDETKLPVRMPAPGEVCIFQVTPTVISVLDYTKGFGHCELVYL